jgi:hypothetical protein
VIRELLPIIKFEDDGGPLRPVKLAKVERRLSREELEGER